MMSCTHYHQLAPHSSMPEFLCVFDRPANPFKAGLNV